MPAHIAELDWLRENLLSRGMTASASHVQAAIDEIAANRRPPVGENVGSTPTSERHWPASYDETFRAIAAAVTPYGNKEFGISVKAFYRALAYPEPSQSTALNVGSVEGSATPAE